MISNSIITLSPVLKAFPDFQRISEVVPLFPNPCSTKLKSFIIAYIFYFIYVYIFLVSCNTNKEIFRLSGQEIQSQLEKHGKIPVMKWNLITGMTDESLSLQHNIKSNVS